MTGCTRLVTVKPRGSRLATLTLAGAISGCAQSQPCAGGTSSRSSTKHSAPTGTSSERTRSSAWARSCQVPSPGVTSLPSRKHAKVPSKKRSGSTMSPGSCEHDVQGQRTEVLQVRATGQVGVPQERVAVQLARAGVHEVAGDEDPAVGAGAAEGGRARAGADQQAARQLGLAGDVDGRGAGDVPQQVGGEVGEVGVGRRVDGRAARGEQAVDVQVHRRSGEVDDDSGPVGHPDDLEGPAGRPVRGTEARAVHGEDLGVGRTVAGERDRRVGDVHRAGHRPGGVRIRLGREAGELLVVRRESGGHAVVERAAEVDGRPVGDRAADDRVGPEALPDHERRPRRGQVAADDEHVAVRVRRDLRPGAGDADPVGTGVAAREGRVAAHHHDTLGARSAPGDGETSADQHGDVAVEVVGGRAASQGRPGHRAGVSHDERGVRAGRCLVCRRRHPPEPHGHPEKACDRGPREGATTWGRHAFMLTLL